MGLNKRRGRIELPEGWIQSNDLDILTALFSDFYPLWIDSAGDGALMYHGLSEHFKEIEDGDDVPQYGASVIIGEKYNFIEFEKIG
jgi:hypothetical protein